MEPWILFITVVLFGTLCQECFAKTHFKYMTNYCSETVKVTESLVVVLAPSELLQGERSPDYFHCSVDLMATKGRRLHVHFLHLSISADQSHTDRLKLYDIIPGRDRVPLTPAQGLYGMLDKTMRTSDTTGATVGDFRSGGRWMQVEYLGKPTQIHSGFRMLVTTTADKDASGKCPVRMYACPSTQWCIPSVLFCDRYPNCGMDDLGDEDGCQVGNLASSVSYSLSEDIVLIIFLPLVLIVVAVLIVFFYTRRHVNRKYPPKLPTVKYMHEGDGEIEVGGDGMTTNTITTGQRGAPPSYTEALAATSPKPFIAKPPSYNMLEELGREGRGAFVESDDNSDGDRNHHHHNPHHRRNQHHQQQLPFQHSPQQQQQQHHPNQHYSPILVHERRSRDILTTSNSSLEQVDERNRSYSSGDGGGGGGGGCRSGAKIYHDHHHHHDHQRHKKVSPRHITLLDRGDFSCSEDEETKRRARRKGGKCKSKGKRRADDLICTPTSTSSTDNNNIITNTTTTAAEHPAPCSVSTGLPHSISSNISSSISSPLASPSSTNSNISVPCPTENAVLLSPSLSAVSSNTGSTNKSLLMNKNQSPGNDPNSKKHVAVIPLSSSSNIIILNGSGDGNNQLNDHKNNHRDNNHNRHYQEESVLHSSDNFSASSGPEADRKSETGSLSFNMADSNNTINQNFKTESCASSNCSNDGESITTTESSKNPRSNLSTKDNDIIIKTDSKQKCVVSCEKDRRKNGELGKKGVKKNGKVSSKKRETKHKINGGNKVIAELSPLDRKLNGCKGGDDDDNDIDDSSRELCDDADVSSDSDNGVEVDLRKQEVVSLNKKKLLTKV